MSRSVPFRLIGLPMFILLVAFFLTIASASTLYEPPQNGESVDEKIAAEVSSSGDDPSRNPRRSLMRAEVPPSSSASVAAIDAFGGVEQLDDSRSEAQGPKTDCKYGDWGAFSACSKTCGGGKKKRFRKVVTRAANGGAKCKGSDFEEADCGKNDCPKDCSYEAWSDWSSCSQSCGKGTETRKRTITAAQYGGKNNCKGDKVETRQCNKKECPQDCKWDYWKSWSACSKSCGGGKTTRFRKVLSKAAAGGQKCDGSSTEAKDCSPQACPVDCAYSDWSSWGSCSVSCGDGHLVRKRTIATSAAYGGQPCPDKNLLTDKRSCSMKPCPVDCQWAAWQPWRGCSTTCGAGREQRARMVQTPAANGGRECNKYLWREERVCNLKHCPIHCEWDRWSQWSSCSGSCGNGTRVRKRTINIKPNFGGDPCKGPSAESIACQNKPCPIDCKLENWGAWGQCSSSCGNGTQVRRRFVDVQPSGGGKECNGTMTQKKACENLPNCPVDCKWADWASWGACSKSCGSGKASRKRTRKQYAKYGGHVCYGTENEDKACNEAKCPIDCKLSDWAEWSPCSTSCGNATKFRSRGVDQIAMHGGKGCGDAPLNETKACQQQPCPIHCKWGNWSVWTPCSKSCGGGEKQRSRTKLVPAQFGGRICDGLSNENATCNVQGCPVDCEWNPWSEWKNCSATCGGGTKLKTRTVKIAALWGGKPCKGDSEAVEKCNTQECAIDCKFSLWSEWSKCSASCGGGAKTRNRTHAVQAKFGGLPCVGPNEEEEECNTQGCPRDCVWGNWSDWSVCTRSCGKGTARRFRDIAVTMKNGGKPCAGSENDEKKCNEQDCPVDCQWSVWGDWTPCSVTCDGGFRRKSRSYAIDAAFGGKKCIGNTSEQETCNSQHCPKDCKFSEWSHWSPCSVSCGAGEKRRTRVKEAELNGGKPCIGEMLATAKCQQAEHAVGCPTTTTTTTKTMQAENRSWDPMKEHDRNVVRKANESGGVAKKANESNDRWMDAYLNNLTAIVSGTSNLSDDGKKFRHAFDKKKTNAVATVDGDFIISASPSAEAFKADPKAKEAMMEAVSSMAGVPPKDVKVDLVVRKSTSLIATSRRLEETNLDVAYQIATYAGDLTNTAQAVAQRLAQQDISDANTAVVNAIAKLKLPYAVSAKSMSVVILPVVAGGTDKSSLDLPKPKDPLDDEADKKAVKSHSDSKPDAPPPAADQTVSKAAASPPTTTQTKKLHSAAWRKEMTAVTAMIVGVSFVGSSLL
eukprot:TRINITY_DN9111_c0_g10_i1.p1 TRINITY_DN9111_c0_g10~~TRINITY_DN9111_c0_g10_i1.p1  ORF type:complete len:1252 (+),score=222.05 TRINITY_DN9111_c0_g10_i1:165-3920(+)